ncbi:MAG: hypothetical protein VYD35_05320 [Actinomycetota bacterium]|nr:hypothetical protein [Actinomycetota bacterium]MEC8119830.1 hypothetical protein [Actinomycetota bacterium]
MTAIGTGLTGLPERVNHWEAFFGKPTRPPSAQADGSDLRPKGIKRQKNHNSRVAGI